MYTNKRYLWWHLKYRISHKNNNFQMAERASIFSAPELNYWNFSNIILRIICYCLLSLGGTRRTWKQRGERGSWSSGKKSILIYCTECPQFAVLTGIFENTSSENEIIFMMKYNCFSCLVFFWLVTITG